MGVPAPWSVLGAQNGRMMRRATGSLHVTAMVAVAAGVTIAGSLVLSGPASGTARASAPAEAASPQTALTARAGVVRACTNPASWSATELAESAVMPGVTGSSRGLPAWLNRSGATAAGALALAPSDALRAGWYARLDRGPGSPLIAVDYEGGGVSRHAAVLGVMPSARTQARTMSLREIRSRAAARGRAMARHGISVDFAPVVDLDLGSPVIGPRSYGRSPANVSARAGAFAQGLQSAGVLPVLKHFPGHGAADADSHLRLPTTPRWSTLRNRDLRPYRVLLHHPGRWGVMVGHLYVPGLSSARGLPTSLDPAVYRVLRKDVGFNGVAFTDSLNMGAVAARYPAPTAVVRAVAAGADVALLDGSSARVASVRALAQWGRSTPTHRARLIEAARRVQTAKGCAS